MSGEPVWDCGKYMVEFVNEPLACASGDGLDERLHEHEGDKGSDCGIKGNVEVGHRVMSEIAATFIPFAPGLPCLVLTGNSSTLRFRDDAQGTT